MKLNAHFKFSIDVKEDASHKVRTVKDDKKLKQVIEEEFFDDFQVDLIDCDVKVTSCKMTRNTSGIQAVTTLSFTCEEEVSVSEMKDAVRMFVKVFGEKSRLESGDFEVWKYEVSFSDSGKGKTKTYKDCKVGYTRNSKTMRCRKNK